MLKNNTEIIPLIANIFARYPKSSFKELFVGGVFKGGQRKYPMNIFEAKKTSAEKSSR